MKFSFTSILLCLSLNLFASWEQKVNPQLLEKARQGETVECIVELVVQANVSHARNLQTKEEKGRFVFETLKATADRTQPDLVAFLEKNHLPYRTFYIVNAVFVKCDVETLERIAQRPDVAFIHDNPVSVVEQTIVTKEAPRRSPDSIEWGIKMIGADVVWDMGYTGKGVVVGGQDTGYKWNHPALKEKYRGYDTVTTFVNHNYNWHDAIHEINPLHNDSIVFPWVNPCGLDAPHPCDDNNHGTHTMGIMVGEDTVSQFGLAPDARWIGARNMERGYGTPITYLECFQWFLAPTDLNNQNPKPGMAPHVINNSWRCPEMEGCTPANFLVLGTAVYHLKMAGIVVVVSAGNEGPGCGTVNAPAAMYEHSFSVGATAENDSIAGFSSRGAVEVDGSMRLKPDISAPGTNVRSSIANNSYSVYSGTSMAGPYVAGVVALMISANPDLAGQVDVIENIIEQTAVPKTDEQECANTPGDAVPNNTYGYGRIDALAAVQAALDLMSQETETGEAVTSIDVFPNPFHSSLTVQLPAHTGTSHFDLFDAMGRRVLSHKIEGEEVIVHTPDLHPGIYFYRIDTGQKSWSGKILKGTH